MNQPVTAPDRLQPAVCPLLAAVLPVRYAIGPIDPRNPSTLDAAVLGLPPVEGLFPDLGPDHPQNQSLALGYVPRMLRDGWLYLWDEPLQELNEYEVKASILTLTGRGGGLHNQPALAYLMLEAGMSVRLVWSPVRWSDEHFSLAEQQPELRQRLMREMIPGSVPASGQVQVLHPQIGDIKPENFRWSCAPKPSYWLLEEPPLKRMRRCEQHHFALVDDTWGVLLDLAGLLRARTQAFDTLSRHRADDWSIATIVQSMGNSDETIRGRLASIIDLPALQRTLREQKRETQIVEADRLRLADIWAAWFATLGGTTPSSLESACEHFDISLPAARDMFEASFAAACLGPAATSPGVKAIKEAADVTRIQGEPQLLWALLGLTQRVTAGELQKVLQVSDSVPEIAEDLGKTAVRAARVTALVTAINLGADNLEKLPFVGGGDPLFAAVSPVIGPDPFNLAEQVNHPKYGLLIAMLLRSRQRLDVGQLSAEDSLHWMSDQVEPVNRQLTRGTSASSPISTFAKRPLTAQVGKNVLHLYLVRSPNVSSDLSVPEPGYGSPLPKTPSTPRSTSAPALPSLRSSAVGVELPRNIKDLINDAPLKTLIAMVSVWNLGEVGRLVAQDTNAKNTLAAGSVFWTTAAATTAVFQHLADTEWERHVAQAGRVNPAAQKLLADALGFASAAVLLQAITAGIDVFYFGLRALDAYRAGDLDTAGVNTGLAGASLAYASLSVEALRALRIARAAVLAGDATALSTGLRVLSLPLRLSLVGLVVTIVAGVMTLFLTEDEPLEQWLKQSRFGTRSADWSYTLSGTLEKLYQIVMPVSLKLERWQEVNPRTGQIVQEVRLVLRLPGQREYRQGMLSFDGEEEWEQAIGLFSNVKHCRPLVWGEYDRLPFDLDTGTHVRSDSNSIIPPELFRNNRSVPQSNGLRLRRVYHNNGDARLIAVRGRLTYQPIDGLYLPPIDIDVS